ncbi:MAG TPA: MFS transporter [Blastocatellia bacterium]|nr:MFS transporter [Blastocatellia bacterium]
MQSSPSILSTQPHLRQLSLLAHIGFILIGVVNTFLGPLLPLLSAKWLMDDAQAGALIAAQFIGSMLGAALSGWLISRLGLLRLLTAGFGLMAAAVAGISANTWGVGLVAVFCSGFSLGVTIPAINLLIAEMNPERRAAALNVLNFVWCLGAVASSPFITLLGRNGLLLPMLGLAMLLTFLAASLARFAISGFVAQPGREERVHSSAMRAWLSPYALLTGALVFLYVGTESAAGGWLASYAQRVSASASPLWAMSQSIFWVGLLLGRGGAPLVLRRMSGENLVLAGLLVAVAGLAILLASNGLAGILLGGGVAGLGLAAVFPTTFALFTERHGALAAQMVGVFFVLTGLGGATIPWAVGAVSEWSDNLRIGLVVTLIGGLIMVALQVAIISILARTKKR